MANSIGSGSSLAQWTALIKTPEDVRIAKFAKDPATVAATADFQRVAATLKSPEDLFAPQNYKTLNYVLTAFGLQSEIGNTGELRKIAFSDLTDENSLANRMDDPRFQEFAIAMNFKDGGLTGLQDPSAQAGIVARYQRGAYEASLGAQNPALREAQYFVNNISNVKDIYSVLGDHTLRDVVSVSGNIPQEEAYQGVEAQAGVFARAFDVDQSANPTYVARYVQRYLALNDLNDAGTGANDPTLQMLGDSGGDGMDLSQIQGIGLLI